MSHYFYITPEEYEAAARNGVDAFNLERRIRLMAWPKEKAINTPLRKLTDRKKWRRIAEVNGIGYAAFISRINRGWDEQTAATKPLQTAEESREQALLASEKVRVIPREIIDLARRNGIRHATLHDRIKKGMSFEEAATRPLWNHSQAGAKGAAALRAREGDWAAQIFGKRKEVRLS